MNALHQRLGLALLLLAAGWSPAHGQERIANEGTIGDRWMLADGATLAAATYPMQQAELGHDVCIALGYRIETDGKTSSFSVLKQWNSGTGEEEPTDGYWQSFAQSAADAVSQWRFKPRPGVERVAPTLTVATLNFQAGGATPPAQVREHCRIDDLESFIRRSKARFFERGDMNKQLMEHERMRDHQRAIDEALRRANGG